MRSHQATLKLEPLEDRQAPATLVNATTVTFQDVDGDQVQVLISKPIFTTQNVNNIFSFDTGSVGGSNANGQQLQVIDLTAVPARGASLSILTTQASGGDGLVNVGWINAAGRDLNAVTVHGDLGRIDAGDNNALTPGLLALNVQSMGRAGLSTQGEGGSLSSNIHGKLERLNVASDIVGAVIDVTGDKRGKIGSLGIGGSLTAGADGEGGFIQTSGAILTIFIGGDLVGGDGDGSGAIVSGRRIININVRGSIVGGAGAASGSIESHRNMGTVVVSGDIRGGAGDGSGAIRSVTGYEYSAEDEATFVGGKIASVRLDGSVIGGVGAGSGVIAADSDLATVRISGDLIGGSGDGSAAITSGGNLGSVEVTGDVVGGSGEQSGTIRSHGSYSYDGGSYDYAPATFIGGTIGKVEVGGSLIGGEGANSGAVLSDSDMGDVLVTGDIVGGIGDGSGAVRAGDSSSYSYSYTRNTRADYSYSYDEILRGRIASVQVGGSLLGGDGARSGSVESGDHLGPVQITGDMIGGVGESSGAVVSSGRIESLSVHSITSGTGLVSGSIRADQDIMAITVQGDVLGSSASPVIISAVGQAEPVVPNDVAIGTLTVNGRVEFANILAGYDTAENAVNGDAQIKNITVGGDWIASNAVAGAVVGADGRFGTNDDASIGPGTTGITGRIRGITIGGQVAGTPDDTDHFGFVAEWVQSLRIGGVAASLSHGRHNDDLSIGATADVRVQEV